MSSAAAQSLIIEYSIHDPPSRTDIKFAVPPHAGKGVRYEEPDKLPTKNAEHAQKFLHAAAAAAAACAWVGGSREKREIYICECADVACRRLLLGT